jgi:glycosyltransferase involved in cell wall biosynthesis
MVHIGLNAHLLSSRAGYRTAGIHGYIDYSLRHLASAAPEGWRFTAMVGRDNLMTFDRITVQRSNFNTESPLGRIFWEQFAQPWQLGAFDLYHALAFVSPLWLSRPSVVTIYDLSFIHYPQVLSAARRLYLRLFTAVSCRRARRVIGISHSTARDIEQSLGIPASKIDVAAPGYDRERYKPLATDEIREFKRRKNLPERFWLFVGTLEPRKNLPVLLDAYAAIPKSQRLPLVLGGGKGWDYEAIFSRIEQHKLDDVQWVGFLPWEELAFWYNSAEIFIYPSVFEGFGLPVLEAMACGTPVIVSDVSSLPEVAGNVGLMVRPHDVGGWAQALRRAFADNEWRREASQRGQEKAACFSWEETARRTIESYCRALEVNL